MMAMMKKLEQNYKDIRIPFLYAIENKKINIQ